MVLVTLHTTLVVMLLQEQLVQLVHLQLLHLVLVLLLFLLQALWPVLHHPPRVRALFQHVAALHPHKQAG